MPLASVVDQWQISAAHTDDARKALLGVSFIYMLLQHATDNVARRKVGSTLYAFHDSLLASTYPRVIDLKADYL